MKALIFALLLALPQRYEDRGDPAKPAQLATIATVLSGYSVDQAAALLMLAYWESGLSLQVHEGHCKSWECDQGRSRGIWQVQQNTLSVAAWNQMIGVENTDAQAAEALWRWEQALKLCKTIPGAVARYMGQGCDWSTVNTRARVRDYERFKHALGNRSGEREVSASNR